MAGMVKMGRALLTYSQPKLLKAWSYIRVEMRPPSPSEAGQISKSFGDLVNFTRSQAWKQMTVREAALHGAIGVEVLCWFFVGEAIGRRNVIGYYVDQYAE